jgi:predicted O-methyltransferase YrrM
MTTDDDQVARRTLAKRFKRMGTVLTGDRQSRDVLKAGEAKDLTRMVRQEVFDVLRRQCRLRELPAPALFAGLDAVEVPLGVIDDESGHANHAEMSYVIAASKLRGPRRIFEFGTFIGRTALHLARINPDAEVWTLDLPRVANPWRFADRVGTYFANAPEAGRIHFLRRDARTFDTTPYRSSMDFIWVDGDHSYEGVKNDTEKAFEMLAPGGAIFWHDFGPDSPELARYFVEFTRERPLFHIRRTSILVHLDGVDPLAFEAHAVPFSKEAFRGAAPA